MLDAISKSSPEIDDERKVHTPYLQANRPNLSYKCLYSLKEECTQFLMMKRGAKPSVLWSKRSIQNYHDCSD